MASAPTLGLTPTPAQVGARKSKTGLAHAGVAVSSYTKPGTHAKATVDPPLVYNLGPYSIPIQDYDFRFVGVRADGSRVTLTEITNVTWDDSSAVLTGAVTFQTPEWAKRVGLVEGNHIEASVTLDRGRTWTPLWLLQIVQPNTDFVAQNTTANLVNDLNRLAQSIDTWSFSAGKAHPGPWTVEEVLRTIFDQYLGKDANGRSRVKVLPKMATQIKKWHPIDQHPLDVVHSALLREKNATGIKYAVMMDAAGYVKVTPYRRTTTMYQLGPALIAATLSTQLSDRFATTVTMRTDPVSSYGVDAAGHVVKSSKSKLAVIVTAPTGQQVYGYIHRDLYSPDATTARKLTDEGKLFLASVAKPINSWVVTLPGMPFIRRLDAVEIVMPQWGTSQVVWVSDARHTLDGTSGYQTELTLMFDDPFLDDWKTKIQSKLSDIAITRNRKAPKKAVKITGAAASKVASAHSASATPPTIGGTSTSSVGTKG